MSCGWPASRARRSPGGGTRTELHADFAELRRDREALDARIAAWADGVEPGWLASPFRFFSLAYRRERVLPTWLLVAQLFNHQTHHRGQITTLLSQLGVDYGVTDLPFGPVADELERALLTKA